MAACLVGSQWFSKSFWVPTEGYWEDIFPQYSADFSKTERNEWGEFHDPRLMGTRKWSLVVAYFKNVTVRNPSLYATSNTDRINIKPRLLWCWCRIGRGLMEDTFCMLLHNSCGIRSTNCDAHNFVTWIGTQYCLWTGSQGLGSSVGIICAREPRLQLKLAHLTVVPPHPSHLWQCHWHHITSYTLKDFRHKHLCYTENFLVKCGLNKTVLFPEKEMINEHKHARTKPKHRKILKYERSQCPCNARTCEHHVAVRRGRRLRRHACTNLPAVPKMRFGTEVIGDCGDCWKQLECSCRGHMKTVSLPRLHFSFSDFIPN